MVDGHGLAVLLDGPGERHHDLKTGQGNARLVIAVGVVGRPRRQDVQQVGADEVRFGQTTGDVHAVRLFVVEADPSLEVAQHLEGVVSELVAVVVVDTVAAELDRASVEFKEKEYGNVRPTPGC